MYVYFDLVKFTLCFFYILSPSPGGSQFTSFAFPFANVCAFFGAVRPKLKIMVEGFVFSVSPEWL